MGIVADIFLPFAQNTTCSWKCYVKVQSQQSVTLIWQHEKLSARMLFRGKSPIRFDPVNHKSPLMSKRSVKCDCCPKVLSGPKRNVIFHVPWITLAQFEPSELWLCLNLNMPVPVWFSIFILSTELSFLALLHRWTKTRPADAAPDHSITHCTAQACSVDTRHDSWVLLHQLSSDTDAPITLIFIRLHDLLTSLQMPTFMLSKPFFFQASLISTFLKAHSCLIPVCWVFFILYIEMLSFS